MHHLIQVLQSHLRTQSTGVGQRINLRAILMALAALSLALSCLHAQVTTATLYGTVTDKSGSVVPGATVTATNTLTNIQKQTTAGEVGDYRLDFLPIGPYKVEVSANGFGNSIKNGVSLSVNQMAKVDFALEPGSVTVQVEVTAAVPVMNIATAEVGTTIDNVQVTELPMVNRNVYSLLAVVPGVQSSSTGSGLGLPEQSTTINGGVGGGYSGTVNYYLDGGNNVTSLRNAGSIMPNPDALQEFRVSAINYSAQYGRFPAGVVNAITKSGSNSLHGSAFNFWRNDELNAYPWHSTAKFKAPLHRNQFGATLGGRILKDKLFFFGSYAGLRETIAAIQTGTVVSSAAERNANNAGYYSFNEAWDTTPLLNPWGGVDPTTHKYNTVFSCNGIANAICANDSHLDPVALAFLKKFEPSPNTTVSSNYGARAAWQGSILTPDQSDEFLLKIDNNMFPKHLLTGMYFNTPGNSIVNAGSSPVPYARIMYSWRQQNLNLSDTWTISDRMVNQFWVAYTRAFGARTSIPAQSLADFGSAWNPLGPATLANIGITNYHNFGNQISGPLAGNNFYIIRDLVSLSYAKHDVKIGGEASLNKDAQYTNLNNYGNWSFGGTAFTGNGFADFLLGLASGVNQDQPVRPSTNTFIYSAFVQDDYRVTHRLTLNLGLRYDLQTVPTDPANLQDTFIPGGPTSTVRPTMPAGLLFPGDKGVPRGIASMGPYHFSPRLGFALDVFGDGKTAVRGGIGMFWGGVSGNGWNQPSNFQPFSISGLTFSNAGSVDSANNYVPNGATLSNPYRNYPGGSPFPYNGTYIVTGSNIKTIDLNYHWPYTYQMNLSVQQRLGSSVAVTLAYVGSLAHNIAYLVDKNYPVFYAPGTGPATATGSACTTSVIATCGSTTNGNNVRLRRPLPNIGQIQQMYSNIGSNYHGLQLIVEKRLSQGISITSSYVLSKTLSGAGVQNTTLSGQDYNNVKMEYGSADTDQRQAFNTAMVWQVNYLHRGNKILQHVVNGWQISPIIRLDTGLPLNITNGQDANLDGNGTDRPTLIGNWRPSQRSTASWFNGAAFQLNAPSATSPNATTIDGTTPRNMIPAPGIETVDLGLGRHFNFFERYRLELRAEATNAFNHGNLSSPGTSKNSSSSFGVITSAGTMRQVQLGARVTF